MFVGPGIIHDVAGTIGVDTTNFDGILSGTQDDVQKALDRLDDYAVNVLGDTMQGNLDMDGNDITGAGTITGTTLTDGTFSATAGEFTNVTSLAAIGDISTDAGVLAGSGGLNAGAESTSLGVLRLYSVGATGSTRGGEAYIYTAGSYDDDVDYYLLAASSANLIVKAYEVGVGLTTKLAYVQSTDTWDFATDVNLSGVTLSGNITLANDGWVGNASDGPRAVFNTTDDYVNILGASLRVDNLTASRLVATDADKDLTSVADLTSWIAGTANETAVTGDGDGTVTIGLVDSVSGLTSISATTITDGVASLSAGALTGVASIATPSSVTMAEDGWIGIASDAERIVFDGSGDLIDLITARVGLGSGTGATSRWGTVDINQCLAIDAIAGYYSILQHNLYYTTGWVSRRGGPGAYIKMQGGSAGANTGAILFAVSSDAVGLAQDAAVALVLPMMITATQVVKTVSTVQGNATRTYFEATGTTAGAESIYSAADGYLDYDAATAHRFRVGGTYLGDFREFATSGFLNLSYENRLYIGKQGQQFTVWDSGSMYSYVDIHIQSDSKKLMLGAGGDDAEIYYNGTNLIIDPDVTGTGKVLIGATGDDDLIAGNVGIGTTSPSTFGTHELVVNGASDASICITAASVQAFMTLTQESNQARIARDDGDLLVVGTRPDSTGAFTEQWRTDTSGNIQMQSTRQIQFCDSDIGIYSQSDSNVTMFADGSITLDAPTVTAVGNMFVGGITSTGLYNDHELVVGDYAAAIANVVIASNPTSGISRVVMQDSASGSDRIEGEIRYYHASDQMTIHVNHTEQIRIVDGGVGIGTTSPQRNLHVHQSDSAACLMTFTNSATGATVSDGLLLGLGGDESGYVWHYENEDIIFGTNNVERMRLLADGDLLMAETNQVQFRDDASYITSDAANRLDLYATNIDLNGIVQITSTLNAVGAIFALAGVSVGSSTLGSNNGIGIKASAYTGANTGVKLYHNAAAANDYGMIVANNGDTLFQFANAGNVSSVNLNLNADNRKLIFGTGLDAEIYYDGSDLIINPQAVGTGGVIVQNMKSGATQVAAGAAAGEFWKTASHATLPDNVVMIGV